MASRLRIIVTGLIAQYPLGGVTWDYLQYVLGLRDLGHDVYYIEDSGQWPYNPEEGGLAKDHRFNVAYLAGVMAAFDLDERWAYRFPWESQWFGLTDRERKAVVESADLVINVSGTLEHPEAYRGAQRLAYIDTDPVFTQIKLARGQTDFRKLVNLHDVHFSFGERLSPLVPATGHDWRPTRQPVVLAEWQPAPVPRQVFTTVMNWTSYKPVEHDGKVYGQKDVELQRFLDLPSHVPDVAFELAVNTGKTRRTPRALLAHKGWQVVHPDDVCSEFQSYRSYICSSKAEWGVAKNGYVVGEPGWFSCRSACYLAAGRPVVAQETGFSSVLPVGEGLLAFRDLDEAAAAVRDVVAHYPRHALAAREIAVEWFDAGKVLSRLIDETMAGPGR